MKNPARNSRPITLSSSDTERDTSRATNLQAQNSTAKFCPWWRRNSRVPQVCRLVDQDKSDACAGRVLVSAPLRLQHRTCEAHAAVDRSTHNSDHRDFVKHPAINSLRTFRHLKNTVIALE